MRKLGLAVVVSALLAAPGGASAGLFAEASLGLPWQLSPTTYRQPTNILITPGYSFLDLVSVELGLVANFSGFSKDSSFGLRPMVGLRPPAVPLYGKLILDFNELGKGTVTSFGGALGSSFGFGPVHLFLEVDYLPRSVGGTNHTVVEGRAGVSLSF
jgi:hypothetical protein